jgi:non-homologous end joining protein Ku
MAEAGVVGLGRRTLSRREGMVVVEPRGTGMALFTLRAAEEVRAAQFGMAEGELDAEMVAIAKAMIVRTPRHHTSAALGGMPAKSCPPHCSFGSLFKYRTIVALLS